MDSKEIRMANLELLIKEAGTKAELSRRMKKRANYLNQLHPPKEGKRAMGDSTARRLEAAMKKPRGWMDIIHDQAIINVDSAALPIRKVRLISWGEVGRLEGMMSQALDGESAPVVYADASIGDGSFALRVRGDSMVHSAGGLSFPDGCVIVVDPTVKAAPGDQVIVTVPAAPEAIFKTLEFDGQQYFLKPLNARYPIVPMPTDAHIVGVVVSVQTAIQPRSRQ
jgi:SOS-response transcriptional repressor LexA